MVTHVTETIVQTFIQKFWAGLVVVVKKIVEIFYGNALDFFMVMQGT